MAKFISDWIKYSVGVLFCVKNEYHGRTDFRYHFEMYVIDIEKFNGEWCYQVASDELTYYVSEDVPAKEYTLTQIVQLCFDTIDEAIDESEKIL